jgi:radical SAM superfamily enzyme YgiQ (UPF0313 family)
MKLILINPNNDYQKFPPLSLAIIASLTPKNWEIEILDNNFEEVKFKSADLVGITSFTCTANKAYEYAKLYRDNNVKVVMGGIHASILPDEALNYVDCVVIGEAEGVWGKVIEDFEKGELKQTYKAELMPFEKWPIPRHDLLHPWYTAASIQTSRGCPFNCDFCSVTMFNGNKYRQRPVDEVIEELKVIKKEHVFFLDDNIIGVGNKHEERAIELFKRMKSEGIKKKWFSYASVNFADNPKVLKAASECGCFSVFIGFEAEEDEQLKEMNKSLNIKSGSKRYNEIVKKINRHKISVQGGIILGLDADTKESIDNRLKFVLEHGINSLSIVYLTPFPGTKLYSKLLEENRILRINYPEDWTKYNFVNIVFKPKNLTVKELAQAFAMFIIKTYSKRSIRMRALVTLFNSRSFRIAKFVYNNNMRILYESKANYKIFLENNLYVKKYLDENPEEAKKWKWD